MAKPFCCRFAIMHELLTILSNSENLFTKDPAHFQFDLLLIQLQIHFLFDIWDTMEYGYEVIYICKLVIFGFMNMTYNAGVCG